MSSNSGFGPTFSAVWLRLVAMGVVSLVFGEALWLAPGKAQGWSYYLTTAEVLFEVAVRLVVAALFGMALGTLCALVIAPFLWFFKASRDFLVDSVTKVTVVLVVFLLSRYSLEVLIKWSYGISNHPALYDKLLLGAQFVVFAVALCVPRARRVVVTGLDGLLTPKMTRRTAVATMAGAAALVATEFALGETIPVARAALSPNRPKSNFLLITFDALNAEDMSLYGRGLPTTPNIDAFARRATVFKNFYSACTFTTSSVATMMTGTLPFRHATSINSKAECEIAMPINSLPQLLRNGGYHTGAFLTNPFAYYLSTSLASGFDVMPEPVFQQGGLQHIWNATRPLHQQSGVGSRIDEYFDLAHVWNSLGRMPSNLCMRYRPDAAFQDAKRMLANLPDGFFALAPRDYPTPTIPSRFARPGAISPSRRTARPRRRIRAPMEAALSPGPAKPGGPASPTLRRVHLWLLTVLSVPSSRFSKVATSCRTQQSSCRPIMAKVLKVVSINTATHI